MYATATLRMIVSQMYANLNKNSSTKIVEGKKY